MNAFAEPWDRETLEKQQNVRIPHSFHAFPFCRFPPPTPRGLGLTVLGPAPVPLTSTPPPPPSSPSALTADALRRLFVWFGLAFALVPWLPVPPLVVVPCWLCCATIPTLVGGCCSSCCVLPPIWFCNALFCIAGDMLRVAGEAEVVLTGRLRCAACAGETKWELAPGASWSAGLRACCCCCCCCWCRDGLNAG